MQPSISIFKKAGGRLALSLYVFYHNASAGPRRGRGGGGGARASHPHEEDVSVLKKIGHYMYGNGLVEFGCFRVF